MTVGMDALDLQILRNIGIRPYGTQPQDPRVFKPAFLAKQANVKPETVKHRLSRMEKTGLIAFYQIYPNFRHLEAQGAAYLFRVHDEDLKVATMKKAEDIQGLVEIHNFMGAEMCVDLTYRSPFDLGKKLRLLSEFTGDPSPFCFYNRDMPPVTRKLTRLDWRIIKALRYKARRPLREVAQEVGVSLKTVQRRYARMAREGSIFVVPVLNPGKAQGVVLFELLVYMKQGPGAPKVNSILKATEGNYIYHYVPSSSELGSFDLLLFANSTNEIEELRQKVKAIPGVENVRTLLFRGWKEYTDWMDTAIDESINKIGKQSG